MEEAYALEIVKENYHNFELNLELLKSVLDRPEIRDRKIAVISVAGAFRKGKSFLLGFFLRYLYAKYEKKDATDWISGQENILRGFSWCNGPDRGTSGILMWSHIFLNTADNIAIILLDTQGVFDNQSSTMDCSFIFALSTLLSSVQIYNISQNIQENDLQHLTLFTAYGRMVMEESDIKPFQKLQFLVRDWSYSYKYKYGAEGGREMLENCLKITKKQHKDLKSVREHIRSCFGEIECFLMPHPGLTVANEQDFAGELERIDKEFKDALEELVPLILSPKNLMIKEIEGQPILAKDFITYFHTYVNALTDEEIPKPELLVNATAEASHILSISKAENYYKNKMEELFNNVDFLPEDEFMENHIKNAQESLQMFDSRKKMGSSELSLKYRQKLVDFIDVMFKGFEHINSSRFALFQARVRETYAKAYLQSADYYEKEMNNSLVHIQFLENEEFDRLHSRLLEQALKMYTLHQIDGADINILNEYKDRLENSIKSSFLTYKTSNDEKREVAYKALECRYIKHMNECKDLYLKLMKDHVGHNDFLQEYFLQELHDNAGDRSLETFEVNKTLHPIFFEKYQQQLRDALSNMFQEYKNQNMHKKEIFDAKIELKNAVARSAATELYRSEVEKFMHNIKYYVSAKTVAEKHEQFKALALSEFTSRSIEEGESYERNLEETKMEIERAYQHYQNMPKSWWCQIM